MAASFDIVDTHLGGRTGDINATRLGHRQAWIKRKHDTEPRRSFTQHRGTSKLITQKKGTSKRCVLRTFLFRIPSISVGLTQC